MNLSEYEGHWSPIERCQSVSISGFRCDREDDHDGDHVADLPDFKSLSWTEVTVQ